MPIRQINSSFQKAYVRFLKIRGQPREIALGLSLGLFIGMTPSLGFQTAIAIFLAAILKWNKISAAIGVWITNPFSAPFVYSFTYLIGAKIFGVSNSFNPPTELSFSIALDILKKTPEIFWVLTIGGIIIGLPIAVIGYYLSYSSLLKYQEDIKKKLHIKKKLIHSKHDK